MDHFVPMIKTGQHFFLLPTGFAPRFSEAWREEASPGRREENLFSSLSFEALYG